MSGTRPALEFNEKPKTKSDTSGTRGGVSYLLYSNHPVPPEMAQGPELPAAILAMTKAETNWD